MFHLLAGGQVIVILDKAHYCCVICKLQNVVISGPGTTVIGQQQQTQDAALRGAGVQGGDTGYVVGEMLCWRGSQAASYMEGV